MDKAEICRIIKTNIKLDKLLCAGMGCIICPVHDPCWKVARNANALLREWLSKNDIADKLDLI